MSNKQKIFLVINNIRSAYNVGSIFRTADGAGVTKVYLCGITPTPNDHKVLKTSLGAEEYVPWEYFKHPMRLLKNLQDEKLWLVALEQTKGSESIFSYEFPKNKNIALIVGNEIKGLNKKILSCADKIIEIPMLGKKESLNVAVATGIALYQIIEASI